MRVRPKRNRGTSLIETLVALGMTGLLMLGVLPLFSLALFTDYGSAARTEMTYKAQQVVENLRLISFLQNAGLPLPAGTGVPAPPVDGQVVSLPWQSTDANWAYWGPSGANVVEAEKLPYQLQYSYRDSALLTPPLPGSFWVVSVSAVPKAVSAGPVRLYLGTSNANKSVEYVAEIPK